MTRADINTLILSWLDDLKGAYFTPAQVNVWINLAQRQVQFELLAAGQNWYVIPVETLTVIGQADYALPADFISEHSLEYVLSGTGPNENCEPLTSVTLNQRYMVPTVLGNPSVYYLKKDRFTLEPTPQSQWVLRLYYSPKVQDLQADTDVPDIPEEFMEYVAIVAAMNGYVKDDRVPDNLMAKKNEYLSILKKMASQRKQDKARQVVDVYQYNEGFY